MSILGSDFEVIQREAEARALGGEMYRQAASVSESTVECVSAVLDALANRSRGRLAGELANAYARAMMSDLAATHYTQARLTD